MKGITLAVLLLSGQAALLLMLAFMLPDRTSTLMPLSLKDVLGGKFAARGAGVAWGACGLESNDQLQTYTRQDAAGVWCVSPLQNTSTLVVNTSMIVDASGAPLAFSSISIAPDGKSALIATDYKKIWRHSYTANHYVIDVPYTGAAAEPIAPSTLSPQRFATWSPATSGDGAGRIAFVFGCNLYVVTGTSGQRSVIQVTQDGIAGSSIGGVDSTLCYGVPDWVYEEEVLASADAVWWSPNGESIAFLRSDDSNVPLSHITYESADPAQSPYPQLLQYRMPKPGFPNPIVNVLVYNIGSAATATVDVQADRLYAQSSAASTTSVPAGEVGNRADDYIVARVQWASDSKLVVRVFNRIQNHEQVVVQDVSSPSSPSAVVIERSSPNGWLDFEPALVFVPSSDDDSSTTSGGGGGATNFVSAEPVNGFVHLVLYQMNADWTAATRVGPLTSGSWGITSITGYAKAVRSIIFTSTESGPTRNAISAVGVDSTTAATMLASSSPPQHTVLFNTGYLTTSISMSGELAVVSYNGPNIPHSELYRLSPGSPARAELVAELQNNKQLHDNLEKVAMPEKRYMKIHVDNARVFDAYAIVPFAFDETGATKYPVLFKVYNGPGSQGVVETFSVSFDQYLASLGIVVVQCDGRGTTGRGLEWRHATYMDLGDFEPRDQIDAAAALAKSNVWVDAKRMAIWGWSYGGYVTARVAATDTNDVFRVKMSVAPVTDWRFYDTVYTERFMGLPADNPNYHNSSVLPFINNFDDSFLLVHGLADDNVQYINSAALEEALIAGNKHYTTRFYPNRDHGITGGFTRDNLYTYLVDHLQRYLL